MYVRAVVGFVSTIGSTKYRVQAGDVLALPQGADWVQAGLCVAAGDGAGDGQGEVAMVEAPETTAKTVVSKRSKKKIKD